MRTTKKHTAVGKVGAFNTPNDTIHENRCMQVLKDQATSIDTIKKK